MANLPVIKKRNGAFSVAIFAENKSRADGSEYVSYGAVLQKSYRDPQTQDWKQQSINMFENNVMDVALLLQAAAMALVELKNPVAKDQTAAQPAAQPATQPAEVHSVADIPDDCPF